MITQTVCLFVATLSGMWCYLGAEEIGQCWQENDKRTIYCKVGNVTDLPIRAQWYDPLYLPELSPEENINCGGGSCETMANGRNTADWYYQSVAMPADLIGLTLETEFGSYAVNDTGGGIHPRWGCLWLPPSEGGEQCLWYIPVDFLRPNSDHGIWWLYLIFEEWSLSGHQETEVLVNSARRENHDWRK